MADHKTPEHKATAEPRDSTNVLLAQILACMQEVQATTAAALDTQNQLLKSVNLGLKIQADSKEYLKQLVDSIGGAADRFTVKVTEMLNQKK